MMKKILYISILISLLGISCSEDFLDTSNTNVITTDELEDIASSSPDALIQVVQPMLSGVYDWMITYNSLDQSSVRHNDFGHMAIMLMTDLWNDDMVMVSKGYNWYNDDYILDNRTYTYLTVFQIWNYYYKLIKLSNDIIEKIPEDTMNEDLKAILGQAKGMRAFSYLYLVQLYQHTYVGNENAPAVPIILPGMSPEELNNNPRNSVSEVYELIIDDLEGAEILLDAFARTSKNQLNKQAVQGLLARTYLNMENWTKAAQYANSARTGYKLMNRTDYLSGFNNIENEEWMWGAILTVESSLTQSGIVNFPSHISTLSYGYAWAGAMYKAIDAKLYDAIPRTDVRALMFTTETPIDNTITYSDGNVVGDTTVVWGDTLMAGNYEYANLKFGQGSSFSDNDQDYPFMRAAEMYLIEAEALAHTNAGEAQNVLNEFLASRDTETPAPSATILDEIYFQRQIELWGEGFSWFDHKRLKKAITRNYDGSNHRPDASVNIAAGDNTFLMRIPEKEIEQNEGISESDNNPV